MTARWIEAMRLRTLPVSAAGVVCGSAYAIGEGQFRGDAAALCLVFALLCQIASNFANEYYDFTAGRDRAGREGPRRGVTEGDISPRAMRMAVMLTLGAAAAVGLCLTWFGGLWLIAAGAVIGAGALAYSAGPYPLSTHCLGEAAVIVFFGLVPVSLTYYVQTLAMTVPVLLGSVAIGLMGANVLIVNNTRDIPDDRAVGKHTLATATCPGAMAALYIAFALGAAALTLTFWGGGAWLTVPAAYVAISAAIGLRLWRGRGAALNPLLGMTAMLMLAYAVTMLVRSVLTPPAL